MANNLRSRLKLKENSSSTLNSTPVKTLSNSDREYSPVYLACTQESFDSVDVLWDWNSPQSKSRTIRRPKRIITGQKSSPKLPLKKHTNSTNAHRTLDSMRDELLAFQEEYEADTFIESDLDHILNNNEEPKERSHSPVVVDQQIFDSSDDFFDDSLEQHLVLASQQVEEKLKEAETVTNVPTSTILKTHQTPVINRQTKMPSPRTLTKSFSSDTFLDSPKRAPQRFKVGDSFDVALEEFDDDFDLPEVKIDVKKAHCELGQTSKSSTSSIKASPSFCKPVEGALKFKTKSLSFGHSYEKSKDDVLREEIEKRRLEALAKLRSKKIATVLSDSDTSPIKCSPEEIEIKRQQARAKLEQKRQQELIERNRQEALKKLETRRRQVGKLTQSSQTQSK